MAIDGEVSEDVRDFEFFATPSDVAARLLDCIELDTGDIVLEPSCGDGALLGKILKRESKPSSTPTRGDSAAQKTY